MTPINQSITEPSNGREYLIKIPYLLKKCPSHSGIPSPTLALWIISHLYMKKTGCSSSTPNNTKHVQTSSRLLPW